MLLAQEDEDIAYIKKALNLDNKIYGWMYGAHSYFFELSRNFESEYGNYVGRVQKRGDELAHQMNAQVSGNKIKDIYFPLFKDIINSLKNGLISKELAEVTDFTAKNRFTRDTFEELFEKFIKANTTEEKFRLSEDNGVLQGTMQYPYDSFLTEDDIDEGKFQFSKLLKLPDKAIKYSEIVVAFELQIREKYPFLDYVLKNSELINSMGDFYTVLSFSNELFC